LFAKFLSRKFLIAFLVIASGLVAALLLPAFAFFEWLRPYTPAIFASLCALASAYLGANTWQKHRTSSNGGTENNPSVMREE
jgi:L-lactate permease